MKRLSTIATLLLIVFSVNANKPSFQASEYDKAETILLHEPGSELKMGMLHPQAALFEKYFNIEKSKKEHQNYVKELNKRGIKTLLVRDILLQGCIDENGETIESKETRDLRRLVLGTMRYDVSDLSEKQQGNQNAYKRASIAALSAEELVDILILQPTVKLRETEHNTGITASYEYNPLMNLFYTRDQSITTPNGVVICQLNSPQRQAESNLIKFCYRKIGIKPILEIKGEDAFLEGGDFLLTENCSFIGCGMRTTMPAIEKMMKADAFGTEKVVVVKDDRFYQAEMHLDTYFNIIDKDLVTLGLERMEAEKGDKKYVCVDVYEKKKGGKYKKVGSDISFVDYLKEMNITIIPVANDDQARLANNFLTVAPRTIMAVDGQSKKFKDSLKANGVEVVWLPLYNLTKGYGAAHCMTQVIYRTNK